jgi:hypothetical protein
MAPVLGGKIRRLDIHFADEINTDVVGHAAVRARVHVIAAIYGQAVELLRLPFTDCVVMFKLVVTAS